MTQRRCCIRWSEAEIRPGDPCAAVQQGDERPLGRIQVACRVKCAVQESQRDSVSKPRVVPQSGKPPWVIVPNHSQLQRGCGHSIPARLSPRPQRRWRYSHFRTWTQGSPEKSGQPWAGGHNPFGLESPDCCSKLKCVPPAGTENNSFEIRRFLGQNPCSLFREGRRGAVPEFWVGDTPTFPKILT